MMQVALKEAVLTMKLSTANLVTDASVVLDSLPAPGTPVGNVLCLAAALQTEDGQPVPMEVVEQGFTLRLTPPGGFFGR